MNATKSSHFKASTFCFLLFVAALHIFTFVIMPILYGRIEKTHGYVSKQFSSVQKVFELVFFFNFFCLAVKTFFRETFFNCIYVAEKIFSMDSKEMVQISLFFIKIKRLLTYGPEMLIRNWAKYGLNKLGAYFFLLQRYIWVLQKKIKHVFV